MSIIHPSKPSGGTQSMLGFTLPELVVVVCVVGILATVALDKLLWYQGQAEKATMEYTANMVKSGLWMSAANLMMANRGTDISALAVHNPMNLLEQKPENYLGEINGVDTEVLKAGNWFYDVSTNQIVYVVAQRRYFTPEIAGDFTVRYAMKIIYSEIELSENQKVPYVAGIALIPVRKYTWH